MISRFADPLKTRTRKTLTQRGLILREWLALVMVGLVILMANGCTAPSPTPTRPPLSERTYPDLDQYKQKSEQTKVSLVKILISEAEKFLWQEQYQDALFVFNQALGFADGVERAGILKSVEQSLQMMPAKDIEEFNLIQKISIPRPLLLYWLGVNYGLENDTSKARQILNRFLSEYPDHHYAQDAMQLVEIMSKSMFDSETIGCLLPLSGKYAIFGEQALSGIRLAIQDLNKRHQKNFRLIIRDTKADPLVAVQAVKDLHIRNVAAIIGPMLAVKEAGIEAQNLGIPMIALTQKTAFPLQGDFLFANFINPQMQVKSLGAYLFGTLGIKKVAILYPDEKYGSTYMNLFWDVADEYGVQIVGAESYGRQNTDFSIPIQKLTGEYYPLPDELKPEEPEEIEGTGGEVNAEDLGHEEIHPDDIHPEHPLADASVEETEQPSNGRRKKEKEKIEIDFEALFIPDSPKKVKLILPQLAFNDATGMYIVGTNLWHHKDLLRDVRGYNRQSVIADGFFGASRHPVTARFNGEYRSVFGKAPKFLEAISYDTAMMLFEAAMDDQVDSRVKLKEILLAGKTFEGVTGNTVFDENGNAQRELFLMTIKKGKFVEISR